METSQLTQRVEKALAEIRPFLNSDGGDIKLVGIENNVVTVELTGACTDCSVNQMTLKSGVEMTIKKFAPEIERVENIRSLNPLNSSI